jgi:small subunit ribosomal protein S3Ae
MREIITKFVKKNTLKEVVNSLIVEKFGPEITAEAKKIFPIQNCIIRKVKTLKRPRFDSNLSFIFLYNLIE